MTVAGRTKSPLTGIVSLHDVMPENFDLIRQVVDRLLGEFAVQPLTLLIVPGKEWQAPQIAQIQAWGDDDRIELAGHGWLHKIQGFGSLWHRVHSAVISRNVAEHLERDADGVCDLIKRCHDWFGQHDIAPCPALYVPPAWAMGAPRRGDLQPLPFTAYEYFQGVYYPGEAYEPWIPLPLAGYEADTRFRARALRIFNSYNIRRAQNSGRPLRISIHPHDFEYRLASALAEVLRACDRFTGYLHPRAKAGQDARPML